MSAGAEVRIIWLPRISSAIACGSVHRTFDGTGGNRYGAADPTSQDNWIAAMRKAISQGDDCGR
jgi:hypothetical protein